MKLENEGGGHRRPRSREEFRQAIAEFDPSGMDTGEFCRSRGLAVSTIQQRHLPDAEEEKLVTADLRNHRSDFNPRQKARCCDNTCASSRFVRAISRKAFAMYPTRFNAKYRKTKPEEFNRLMAVINAIESLILGELSGTGQVTKNESPKSAPTNLIRKSLYFSGEFGLIELLNYEYSFQDRDTWKTAVSNAWPNIRNLTTSLRCEDRRATFRFDFARSELDLTIDFPSKEQVDQFVAVIEKDFELPPPLTGYGDFALTGNKSTFYTNGRITEEWFEKAVKLLRELSQRSVFFAYCSVSTTSRWNPDFTSGNLNRWHDHVLEPEQWRTAQFFFCSLSSESLKVIFECDKFRELIWIEVRADARSEVDGIPQNFRKQLGLEPADDDPYRHAMYTLNYKGLSAAKILKFKKATEQAIEEVFTKQFKKQPVVVEAYVAEAESGEVTHYHTVPDFLARLTEAGENIEKSSLYLEGPEVSMLGISANCKEEVLVLRSSTKPKSFEIISAKFKDTLKLTLTPKETSPRDKATTRLPEVLIKFASVAVIAIVSPPFLIGLLTECQPNYTIVIDRPQPNWAHLRFVKNFAGLLYFFMEERPACCGR